MPAPVISYISPTSIPAGSQGFELTITGQNFPLDVYVTWNGQLLGPIIVGQAGDTMITAPVPANLVAGCGVASIVVGLLQGGVAMPSNTVNFYIVSPSSTTIPYFQTPVPSQTNTGALQFGDNQDWEAMPALSLPLPPAGAGINNVALVTLNVPYPFASGQDAGPAGGQFKLEVLDLPLPVGFLLPSAGFTYQLDAPPNSSARMPTTLVVRLPLTSNPATVNAWWRGVRGNIFLDTPASLSAVIGTE